MHSKGHQAYVSFVIKALDGLHQPDIALLDKVRQGQSIAGKAAGDRDHVAQMRKHQLPGRFKIILSVITAGQRLLLFGAQDRGGINLVEIPGKALTRTKIRRNGQ